jgi:hypothetical protein
MTSKVIFKIDTKLNADASREISQALADISKNKNLSPRFRTAKAAAKFLSR